MAAPGQLYTLHCAAGLRCPAHSANVENIAAIVVICFMSDE